MPEFLHLHCHTQYSLLDGAANIGAMMDKAKADGQRGVALTDHGNMFGAFKFAAEASRRELKPIIGCEFYLVNDRHRKSFSRANGESDKRYHQLLLAKNQAGYVNLSKLCSLGFIEGLYSKFPRIDKELLEKHHEGLIATSCCIGAEVPQALLNGQDEKAEELLKWWLDLFGEDYYIELQRHRGLENIDGLGISQEDVNQKLLALARKYNVKVIATNDSHYVDEDDWAPHDILLCINTNSLLEETKRFKFPSSDFYFKTQNEMNRLFQDVPEAVANTVEIFDKIDHLELARDILLPAFPIPDGFKGQDDYLRHLTFVGAKRRYGTITPNIEERLNFELSVIKNSGYPGYFLIVQDFTTTAREMGVSVGPGRGSAAGSAVAYCIGITNVDPIKYDLLFERFLNPERVSMPDIDIDFDDEGRDRIIDYVVNKYGQSQVAQIITYGSMAAKSSIRDVARVMDLPLQDADRISKLVPDLKKFKHIFGPSEQELKKAFNGDDLTNVMQLLEISDKDNEEGRILNQARKLEGSIRNTGIHACGVIITPEDIREFIPVSTAKDSDLLVTQFDNSVVESAGLLKMDFLGLKTLTVMKDAIKLVKERHNVDIDPDMIPLDDEKTFELYQKGETNGTFQFESVGMQKHLKNLKPTDIEDLIAMNALYRPGPLQFIDLFIRRKQGVEEVEYPHDKLIPILKDTYGIMVYQEQIMQTAQILAGYSLGAADILRRAMGKKKMDVMQEQKIIFRDGCKEHNDIEAEKADEIFDIMMKFAEYGFNRSHSAAYSLVAFQTAYLKANYPAEYMASVLTNNMNDIKKVTFFMEECKRMNLEVLGPDVNESAYKFAVNPKGQIRFGMGAIKGVGEGAVEYIVKTRQDEGRYNSIFHFASQLDLRTVNKKNFEGLAVAGAFDCFEGVHRAQYFAIDERNQTLIEKAIKYGHAVQAAANSNQASLFGETADAEIPEPPIPDAPEWRTLDQLNREKEVVGVYITGHPLDDFKFEIDQFSTISTLDLDDLEKLKTRKEPKVGGIITQAAHLVSKTGSPYGRFVLEDYNGAHEFALFKDDYLRFKNFLTPDWFVLVEVAVGGWFDRREQKEVRRLKVAKIELLSELREKKVKKLNIDIPLQSIDPGLINQIKKILTAHKGTIPIQMNISDNGTNIEMPSRSVKVNLSRELTEQLNTMETVRWRIQKS